MFTRKVRNYAVITHFTCTHLQRNAAIVVTRNPHTLVVRSRKRRRSAARLDRDVLEKAAAHGR
jgi:hypothetical protein